MGPVTTVTHVHTIPGPGYTVCLVTVNCDSIDCDCVGDRAMSDRCRVGCNGGDELFSKCDFSHAQASNLSLLWHQSHYPPGP